ncbi:NYN domain-containing protein [Curtobacterium poinsettiae]|uniref:NYN domain-containing protein n=1 Tax=Curtobacterium poinsettiae TaxID=159612 RepID=UPI001BE09FF9|nr:hypothetical protein [Curtobacterium flaccumfaciens]
MHDLSDEARLGRGTVRMLPDSPFSANRLRRTASTTRGRRLNSNPFASRLEERNDRLNAIDAELHRLRVELDWYEQFDRLAVMRKAADAEAAAKQVSLAVSRLGAALVVTSRDYDQVRDAARIGINLLRVFDASRIAAVEERDALLKKLGSDRNALAEATAARDELLERLVTYRSNLLRFSACEPLEVNAAMSRLEAERLEHDAEFNRLTAASAALDSTLVEPLKALSEAQQELSALQEKRKRAQEIERRFAAADTSRDRAMLHEEARRYLGVDSPRVFLRGSGGSVASLERAVAKRQRRVDTEVRRALVAYDARAIVIDGSNLCHDGQSFVGLEPLKAIVPTLAGRYEVTVIFDATIERTFAASTLRRQLADVRVHVAPDKQAADESILDAATEPGTYVISGDKYRDFGDKPAVRDGRVSRPEILGSWVSVRDLGLVNVSFQR